MGVNSPTEEQDREIERRATDAYYRALDEHDYELLADALSPGFVHERPDLTLDGRDEFVRFMRDERPMTETRHERHGVFEGPETVAVQGELLDADGNCVTGFVDIFTVVSGQIDRIETYVDTVPEKTDSREP